MLSVLSFSLITGWNTITSLHTPPPPTTTRNCIESHCCVRSQDLITPYCVCCFQGTITICKPANGVDSKAKPKRCDSFQSVTESISRSVSRSLNHSPSKSRAMVIRHSNNKENMISLTLRKDSCNRKTNNKNGLSTNKGGVKVR